MDDPVCRQPSYAVYRVPGIEDIPGAKVYSGEAVYRRRFYLDPDFPQGCNLIIDCRQASTTTDTRKPGSAGIHALLSPPVRESAVVFINGLRVGSVWHPPYILAKGGLLKPDTNRIEVHAYNTAVNLLAGQLPPDDFALNARYGKRFDRQDLDQIRSLASGLLMAPALRVAGRLDFIARVVKQSSD